MKQLAAGVALLALFAAGCGDDALELDGTSWELAGYDEGLGEVEALAGTIVPLVFEATTLSGSDGCNQFNGTYEVSGSDISIGPLAGTLMACEPDVMEQATVITAILSEAATYEDADGQLIMRTEDSRSISYNSTDG